MEQIFLVPHSIRVKLGQTEWINLTSTYVIGTWLEEPEYETKEDSEATKS